MAAAPSAKIESVSVHEPLSVTLLELVEAVSDVTSNEVEVVATVLHMLESGRVRLSGNFRDASIRAFC
jgi:hypothetical protein